MNSALLKNKSCFEANFAVTGGTDVGIITAVVFSVPNAYASGHWFAPTGMMGANVLAGAYRYHAINTHHADYTVNTPSHESHNALQPPTDSSMASDAYIRQQTRFIEIMSLRLIDDKPFIWSNACIL